MTHSLSLVAFGTAVLMAAPAQAQLTNFQGTFAAEADGATGSGTLDMVYDPVGHTLNINATWAGLSGNTSNAHIHCCTASPNTGPASVALAQAGLLPGFPLGIQSGSYSRLINLNQADQYNASFITGSGGTVAGAEERLINNLASGNAYFNIHTSTFGGGEIRAFVTVVPEPETYALMLAGLGIVGWAAQRRRQA